MKRIELAFYRRGSQQNLVLGWVFLGIVLLLGGVLLNQYNRLQGEQQRIKRSLAQQHERERPLSVRTQEITPQLQRAGRVIEQLSFPWDKLFKTLESSINEDVALLSVQPDLAGHVVTLNAEARNWDAMLAYIRRLEKSNFFNGVHLLSHQLQQNDEQRPVRFILNCIWRGDELQPPP